MLTDPQYLGHLVAKYTQIPSNPMMIRRYRPLNERNLRTFFENGPYCSNLTEFCDNNEGLVEHASENIGQRAGSTAIANMKRRRRGQDGLDRSPEDFRQGMMEFQEHARNKYFANCWRIGTSERERVWKEYTDDDDMIEGFAFETTVGQFIHALPGSPPDGDSEEEVASGGEVTQTPVEEIYAGHSSSDMRVGAVQYQIRDLPDAVQPIGNEASINFFKGSGFDHELEFRFLFNPFDTPVVLRIGRDGFPVQSLPDSIPDGLHFPLDTKELINRIVLAPRAGDEQRRRIEEILDDVGVSYGSEPEDDLKIVESNFRDPPLHERQPYTADFDGTDNYEGSAEHLNEIRRDFCQSTDVEDWPVMDLVELVFDGASTVVEGYRYSTDSAEFDMEDFGHDGYQAVIVNRLTGAGETYEYRNEAAVDQFGELESDDPDLD